jgi:hypothetical protein
MYWLYIIPGPKRNHKEHSLRELFPQTNINEQNDICYSQKFIKKSNLPQLINAVLFCKHVALYRRLNNIYALYTIESNYKNGQREPKKTLGRVR